MIVKASEMFVYVISYMGNISGYVVEYMESFWPVHRIYGAFVVPKPMFFKMILQTLTLTRLRLSRSGFFANI